MVSPSDRIAHLEAELAELRQMVAPAPQPVRSTRHHRLVAKLAALALALGLLVPAGVVLASHQFGDVPTSHQFHTSISAIADAGITTGCGDGTNYCPDGLVTRGQMAAFLNRLGALAPGTAPKVNADKLDGLDSSAFARPLYAVVNANGSLARGAGVVSSSKIPLVAGSYEVEFNRDVTSCAYNATIGNAGAGNPLHGSIVTALRSGTTTAVFVETKDSAGSLADRGFHLQVSCAAGEGAVTIGSVQDAPAGQGANTD